MNAALPLDPVEAQDDAVTRPAVCCIPSSTLRQVGIALSRLGRLIAVGSILGGLLLAVYALGDSLHRLQEEGYSGEKEALKHFVLYPAGAAVAGSVVAAFGLVLMYGGDRALARGEGKSHDGVPENFGTR